MPLLRRYLKWTPVALLAIIAPPFAQAIFAAGKMRMRRRTFRADRFADGDKVVVLPLRLIEERRLGRSQPGGGAVILAFRSRLEDAASCDDPPALTGSR